MAPADSQTSARGPARRRAGVLLALLLAASGFFALTRLPLTLWPQPDAPGLRVRVHEPGIAAPLLEQRVTRLLEARLAGSEGLAAIGSVTRPGEVVLDLRLERGADAAHALAAARRRLDEAAGFLPAAIRAPQLSLEDAARPAAAEFVLVSESGDAAALRAWAETALARALGEIPGVARVELAGGPVREILVHPDQRRLAGLGLAPGDVLRALEGGANEARFGSLDALRAAPVRLPNGDSVPLAEIARVAERLRDEADAAAAGTVRLSVYRQSEADAVATGRRVQTLLAWMHANGQIPGDVRVAAGYDESAAVRQRLGEIAAAGLLGLGLALAVCFALLGLRATFALAAVTGLAALGALALFAVLARPLDPATLGGLVAGMGFAAAVGVVRLLCAPDPGRLTGRFAIAGLSGVAPLVLFPLWAGHPAHGFFPAFLATGLMGYVASWLLAPVLAGRRPGGRAGSGRLPAWLERGYETLAAVVARRVRLAAVAGFALSAAAIFFLAGEMRETVRLDEPRGLTPELGLEVRGPHAEPLTAIGDEIARRLAAVPGVHDIAHSARLERQAGMRLFPERAAALGLDEMDMALALALAREGRVVNRLEEGGRRYDIRVRLPREEHEPPARQLLRGETKTRAAVYLRDVGEVEEAALPAEIRRAGGSYVLRVRAALGDGRAAAGALDRARSALADYRLPPGYAFHPPPAGGALAGGAAIGLVLVLLRLAAGRGRFARRSYRALLSGAPAALIGVAALRALGGLSFSPVVWPGALVIVGLAAALLLLPMAAPATAASATRLLRPLLPAALVWLAALLPFALGLDGGAESLRQLVAAQLAGLACALPSGLVLASWRRRRSREK